MTETTSAGEVQRILRRVARRVCLARAAQACLAVLGALAGCASLLLLAGQAWPELAGLRPAMILLGIAGVSVLGAAVRPVTLAEAAAIVDRAAGLDERLGTALESVGAPGPLARLLFDDAARSAMRTEVACAPRSPRAWAGSLAAVLVLAAVWLWTGSHSGAERHVDRGGLLPVAVTTETTAVARPIAGQPDPTTVSSSAALTAQRALAQTFGLETAVPRSSSRLAAMTVPRSRVEPGRRDALPSGTTPPPRHSADRRDGDVPLASRSLATPPRDLPAAHEHTPAGAGAASPVTALGPGQGDTAASGSEGPTGAWPPTASVASSPEPRTRADVALRRVAIPSALRGYVLRYFDVLRAATPER